MADQPQDHRRGRHDRQREIEEGTMAFDRKEFGMNSGIPFIKIADRVEVIVDIKGKRVSGPPPIFKQ
jgi:polyisoprenoid-binding protein YceI